MKEIFIFLKENAWLRYALGVLFFMIIARKPTLRYFRWMMVKKATSQEVSVYEILRGEIKSLSTALIDAQQTKRDALEEVADLKQINKRLQEVINNQNRTDK